MSDQTERNEGDAGETTTPALEGQEELLGASPAETPGRRVKVAGRARGPQKFKLYHPNGFAVTVRGEARAETFRKRGYTDTPPRRRRRATEE